MIKYDPEKNPFGRAMWDDATKLDSHDTEILLAKSKGFEVGYEQALRDVDEEDIDKKKKRYLLSHGWHFSNDEKLGNYWWYLSFHRYDLEQAWKCQMDYESRKHDEGPE